MICKECKEQELKSHVYEGIRSSTASYYRPFYDENGKHHIHDSNIRTQEFSCSNGHMWKTRSSGSCWCGWKSRNNPSEK